MNILDKMDHKRVELRQVTTDMRGINPHLSLYKELESRRTRLEQELAAMGALRLQ